MCIIGSPGKTHGIVDSTELLKIYNLTFRLSKPTSQDDSLAFKTDHDGRSDIITGVMTWSPMDTEDIRSENESRLPEAWVVLRRVESGVGGDEAGVWGMTMVSRTDRSHYGSGDEQCCQKVPPSFVYRD